ncbi:unnamed protein product [Brassica rapa subsp. narinosa]|uniref:rRNA biogenesis protein RRP36 n=1 Tax=Brassica napus TaxID=3708 RepID=A0A817AFI0_BRANA|nr:unnamed protein product [Brassica napus]
MGKKPYYLKQSEIRKQALIEKYNSLKEFGKLSSFTNGGRRMQQRITDKCLIVEPMPQINKRERESERVLLSGSCRELR